MAHDHHTESNAHRELASLGSIDAIMATIPGWRDPFGPPPVERHVLDASRTVRVVRDDLSGVGTKARAGSALLTSPAFQRSKTVVYVQPRAGWAGLSLARLAQDLGLRLILFCPAARVASTYQQLCAERGAELRAVRVAAMPVLNGLAREFAAKHGYAFLPLGLNAPEAVAGIARVATGLGLNPPQVWCVASTGVLTRGLQLAWPCAEHHVVAVARNLHAGEKGCAEVYSHPLPFLRKVAPADAPPYASALNYDAKVWAFVRKHACDGAVVWNVAAEPPTPKGPPISLYREWHDLSDLQHP